MGVKVTTPVEIKDRDIVDLFISAIEGGINYWCNSYGVFDGEGKRTTLRHLDENPQDVLSAVWKFDEDDGEGTVREVGKEQIEKGLKIMADKYPRHFASIMEDNADAETADVFVQCCALGEIVYG
jgi:hypothetical protein